MAKLKLADLKFGGTYKMKTDQYLAHGYSKGDVVTVVYLQGGSIQVKHANNPNAQQIALYVSHLDFYMITKDQIQKSIDDAKATILENEAKLNWLKQTKNEEFDEDEFKVWHTLQIIKDPATTDEMKAKAIASLIKK